MRKQDERNTSINRVNKRFLPETVINNSPGLGTISNGSIAYQNRKRLQCCKFASLPVCVRCGLSDHLPIDPYGSVVDAVLVPFLNGEMAGTVFSGVYVIQSGYEEPVLRHAMFVMPTYLSGCCVTGTLHLLASPCTAVGTHGERAVPDTVCVATICPTHLVQLAQLAEDVVKDEPELDVTFRGH